MRTFFWLVIFQIYLYWNIHFCNLFFTNIVSKEVLCKGSSIKYVHKIFWKTNISNPWYAHVRVCIKGLEMLVFRNILRTYIMDGPKIQIWLTSCLNTLSKFEDITLAKITSPNVSQSFAANRRNPNIRKKITNWKSGK